MRVSREALVTWTLRVLAPVCVLLAVVGAVRHFSPVPHWDMWPGYVEFWARLGDGRWSEWWALHNEHRIVLARLLFWIDHAVFRGTIVFLVVMNYVLVFAAFLTFRAILLERAGPDAPARPLQLVTLFVLMCLFSWMQKESLVWGFQSQFFLAQWLPLLALYLLYRSTREEAAGARTFAAACIVGVLCIGTMASGVIALPLMVAYALVLGMGWRRVALLALLAAACLAAYFADYQSTPGHGSLRDVLTHRPTRLAQYVLLYLGSPWYHLFKARSIALGQVMGLVLVLLAGWRAWRCLRDPRVHALELALLAFVLYVGGTALGTGAGRLVLGLRQATAERYTTPALMAWLAVLVLYLPQVLRDLAAWRHRIVWPTLAVALLLFVVQLDARRSQRPLMFEREVAAVALELGVLDTEQLLLTVFHPEAGLYFGARGASADISVFAAPWLRDAGRMLGRPAGPLPAAACRGRLLQADALPGERGFRRVLGWIAPPEGAEVPIRALRIVDTNGDMVGYALAGERMGDAMPQRGNLTGTRAFKGYVLTRAVTGPLSVVSADASCQLPVPGIPAPPFDFVPIQSALASVTVTRGAVVRNTGWQGTDHQRSRAPGYQTLGSVVTGDADTGTLVLRLKRGDALLFRTGPITTAQHFRVEGTAFAGSLPRSEHWAGIVFDNPGLPDQFTLTLSDLGTGWGEWSAIGILDQP